MGDFKSSTNDSICRQSSLKFVQEYAKSINVHLSLKEIIKITNVIVDYCQNGYNDNMGKVIDAIDKHIASKFEEA